VSILLLLVHVAICLILIVVILVQGGRGQGLTGSNFSNASVQSLFGTRAADFLTKATTVSAILFLFTCIGLDILEAQRSRSLFETRRPATTPIDVQQIQKVLEKIKAEEAAKPKTETQQPQPNAPKTAEKKS